MFPLAKTVTAITSLALAYNILQHRHALHLLRRKQKSSI